jgi:arylsulfatase A-like enzyme
MKALRVLAGVAATLVAIFLALYLSGVLVIEVTGFDKRPAGSVDQIASLRERNDVNVLFIPIDTLRADRLHAYGYERETSPTIDYLASTGVRFARHMAQSSWTKCSMASLWTGMYPQKTGILRTAQSVPDAATLPAEILRKAGFRTAGIWRNGWVEPGFGFAQGFEVYEKPSARPIPVGVRAEKPNIALDGTDFDLLNAAREFLLAHGRERFFLYLHLMDVHQYMYDENTAVFGATYSDIYDNSVLHTDRIVGRLIEEMSQQGLLEKTLIVLASDHGEAFGERGIEGHAREVFKEETEIPLVIAFPFRLDPGVVVQVRTRNIDVWPTILELLGLRRLPDADGRSLVSTIVATARGRSVPDDVPSIAHLERGWGRPQYPPHPTVAVAKGPHRFVVQLAPDAPRDQRIESLFDESKDPAELHNVVKEEADVAAALAALADGYLASPRAEWAGQSVDVQLDAKKAEELRALGYAID